MTHADQNMNAVDLGQADACRGSAEALLFSIF
jgi:hypothetical protein